MVSMLVASVRELTTGPSTKVGLMTQSLNPCSLDSSQATRSAATCMRRHTYQRASLKEPAHVAQLRGRITPASPSLTPSKPALRDVEALRKQTDSKTIHPVARCCLLIFHSQLPSQNPLHVPAGQAWRMSAGAEQRC
jgi:hypothetical protein